MFPGDFPEDKDSPPVTYGAAPFSEVTIMARGDPLKNATCNGGGAVLKDDQAVSAEEDGGEAAARVDLDRIRRAVREILLAVGEDPEREGLKQTPDRVARMYAEVFSGLHQDPRSHLQTLFTQKYDELVLNKDIRFESFCEHHLLPFIGKAHVAYIPNGKVIGLSKIARVIDVLARRPQMQERLTEEVADLLMRQLDAKGVAVVIEASHTCMTIRGVHKPDSTFVTSAMRGVCKERLATRSEVLALIFGGKP
jgi:GTP cyclohydrolase I